MSSVNSQEYFSNPRTEMLAFLPTSRRRVLEIGCGNGKFAENLVVECEYWGVEPSQEAAKLALTKGMTKVLTGTFREVSAHLPDSYFDVTICNDVIEHMNDHNEFLVSVQRKMAKGGCLVGSIPNVRYISNLLEVLIRRDWRYRDDGILDRTHLRFFTEKSLRRALEECGYEIEQLRGINPWEFSPLSVKEGAKWTLSMLLGADTRFRQFGFRATSLPEGKVCE